MPGIVEEIDGAVQQAPQPRRQAKGATSTTVTAANSIGEEVDRDDGTLAFTPSIIYAVAHYIKAAF
ncbi:hypothetical protein QN360_08565 [Glaciimonas sp. CA11.2]|uniref:hypothetical protein n=1 Tax=unclassified Glaciimonas TaxID=2644401 RepID=UPI002AB47ED9|nr:MULTISPECIES: hypothetical protein [unclassified Glaciimonas]MDY7545331.1 hypothetical protein [Glaciimonas sp. CA11.2]MEB0013799.1 hypothetical protein [Glaciimonas sp. Cout2]MEB0083098.1 hypothetical protein [Glaciimonas sp. Gout2]MEB0162960.1 hypothetical protein [Glaciimonas sp. CA11.2]